MRLFLLALLVAFTLAPSAASQTQPDIVQDTAWVCSAPQDRDLVRLNLSNGSADAIQFRSGCTGRIGRVEIQGAFADCFKVNPPVPAAHDFRIDGGFCHVTGPPAGGVHQDCIQAGGGQNFLIRNFIFDCIGGGGGNYFIAGFNGGDPDDFVCDHCAFGPRHPNQIRTPSDSGGSDGPDDPDTGEPDAPSLSGVRNSLVCQSSSGRDTFGPASGDMGGNITPSANDPQCSWEGLLDYVGSEPPPPPPPPPPDDESDTDGDGIPDSEDTPTWAEVQSLLNALTIKDAELAEANAELEACERKLAEAVAFFHARVGDGSLEWAFKMHAVAHRQYGCLGFPH